MPTRNRPCLRHGHLVIGAVVQLASGRCLPNSAPLLEEEGDVRLATESENILDPGFLHWACPVSTLSAHDGPVDAGDVELSEVFEKGFDRENLNRGRSGT